MLSKLKTDIFVTTNMVLIATRKPTYKEDAMQKTSCQSDKPTVSLLETISGKKKKKHSIMYFRMTS